MGNRAKIYDKNNNDNYIHFQWNGGRDSIEGILEFCKIQGWKSWNAFVFASDIFARVSRDGESYTSAIWVEDSCPEYNDNGGYVIDTNSMRIVDRIAPPEEEQSVYTIKSIIEGISNRMPLPFSLFDSRFENIDFLFLDDNKVNPIYYDMLEEIRSIVIPTSDRVIMSIYKNYNLDRDICKVITDKEIMGKIVGFIEKYQSNNEDIDYYKIDVTLPDIQTDIETAIVIKYKDRDSLLSFVLFRHLTGESSIIL